MRGFNSAVILAGGKSTRMGFDKQLLVVHSKRIVQHLIALLRTRFDDIMVASPDTDLYRGEGVRVVQDIHKGIGPLAGIHSALVGARSEAVFTIACDMPFIELGYIDYMACQLARQDWDACLTRRDGYLETFHAFYCRSGLSQMEREIAGGKYSVARYAEKIRSLIIPQAEAAPYLPKWRAFTNLNTPEDYEYFLRGEPIA